MLYDLSKHSLIEDNGNLVAVFSQKISANQAFKILDDINNAKAIEDLEIEIRGAKDDYEYLEGDCENLKKEIDDLEKDKEKLDDRLQSIIDMLEGDYKFASIDELKEEIIAICAAPL